MITLADLHEQLQNLQAQLHAQPSIAPMPTPETDSVFEPLEDLVQSLRGDLPPLQPIAPPPARGWWVLLGILLAGLAGLVTAWALGWF